MDAGIWASDNFMSVNMSKYEEGLGLPQVVKKVPKKVILLKRTEEICKLGSMQFTFLSITKKI